jgi:hypothetical protein
MSPESARYLDKGFLARAYVLKEIADYETGPDANIPEERSAEAITTATRFVDGISELIGERT